MFFNDNYQFNYPDNVGFVDEPEQSFPDEYMFQLNQSAAPLMAPPMFNPPIPGWQSGSRGIRSCINRNTFIWLNNGNSFWFFPIFVSRQSVVGFRFGRFGWTRSSIRLRSIRSFQCF
jgi:hypothetical protein